MRPAAVLLLVAFFGACTNDLSELYGDAGVEEPKPDAGAAARGSGGRGGDSGMGDSAIVDADAGTGGADASAGGSGGSGGSGGTADMTQALEALAVWTCNSLTRCEGKLGRAQSRARVLDACYAVQEPRVPIADLVLDGDTILDPEIAQACLDAIEASPSFELHCDADVLDPGLEECDGMFTGQLPAGESCQFDLQCGPGLICGQDTAFCGGACQSPGLQGAPCQETKDCRADFFCLDNMCVVRGNQEGVPCLADVECTAGLFCDSGRGRCQTPGGMGDPCVLGQHSGCQDGLLCIDEGTGDGPECTTGSTAGQPCSIDLQPCALGYRCRSGICVPVAGLGETCNTHGQCPQVAYCAGTCELQPGISSPCDEAAGQSCIQGICADGECWLGRPGDACTLDPANPWGACEHGYCSSDGLCQDAKTENQSCTAEAECDLFLSCIEDPSGTGLRTCQVRPECDG